MVDHPHARGLHAGRRERLPCGPVPAGRGARPNRKLERTLVVCMYMDRRSNNLQNMFGAQSSELTLLILDTFGLLGAGVHTRTNAWYYASSTRSASACLLHTCIRQCLRMYCMMCIGTTPHSSTNRYCVTVFW